MLTMHAMLVDFHKAFDCKIALWPEVPDDKTVQLRRALVVEELEETIKALDENDFAEFVDGLIDVLYVAVGTNVTYGFKTVEPIFPRPCAAPAFPIALHKTYFTQFLVVHSEQANIYMDVSGIEARKMGLRMNRLILDLMFVLHECNVDMMPVFMEVHRSNMSKLDENGKPIRAENGKVMKPAHWTRPDILGELRAQERRFEFVHVKE